MENTRNPAQLPLNSEHVAYLHQRAVPIEIAVAAGLASVDGATGARLLGRATSLRSTALAIPYADVMPPYFRLRVDQPILHEGARYLVPAGRAVPVYRFLGVQCAANSPLLVVEGPIKALAVAAAGYAAVGLGGVATTLTQEHGAYVLNESWNRVTIAGTDVVIAFDAGRATNPAVALAESHLAFALERAGAKAVRCVALPLAPGGQDQGPDDFLARHGVPEFDRLVQSAVPADPLARLQVSVDVVALFEDVPFLASLIARGPAVEERVRQAVKGRASVASFDRAFAAFRSRLRQSSKAARHELPVTPRYEQREHGIWIAPAGDHPAKQLTNFRARLTEHVEVDHGGRSTHQYRVEAFLKDGVRHVDISPETFDSDSWPLEHFGPSAVVYPVAQAAKHLRVALQELSMPTTTRVIAHTGFTTVDGCQVFVHAKGALGAPQLRTDVGEGLGKYHLPDDPAPVLEAISASINLLDLAPLRVTAPLLAAMFLAPTTHLHSLLGVLWVYGETSAMKSTIVALFLRHFGEFEFSSLPASWESTANALESLLFRAKDVPVVIDDFAPQSAAFDEHRKKASRLIRQVGNGAARSRLRADLSTHQDRPARGLVICTAEDTLMQRSLVARTIPIRLRKGEVDLQRLSAAQAIANLLASTMTHYLRWLMRLNDTGAYIKARSEAYRSYYASIDRGTHLRAPQALGHLAVGIELFVRFAVQCRALEPEKAKRLREDSVKALWELAIDHRSLTDTADPVAQFVSTLGALFMQRKVCVMPNRNMPLQVQTGGEQVGWRDDTVGKLYLLPGPTYRAVRQVLRASGTDFAVTPGTLFKAFRDRGLLLEYEKGRNTVHVSLGGGRPRVLVIATSAFEDPSFEGSDL